MFIEEWTGRNDFLFICSESMVLVRDGNIMRQYRTESNLFELSKLSNLL